LQRGRTIPTSFLRSEFHESSGTIFEIIMCVKGQNRVNRRLVEGILLFFFFFGAASLYTQDGPDQYLFDEMELNEFIIMPETLLYRIKDRDSDYDLYDVRPYREFRKGHIFGAKSRPWESSGFQPDKPEFPRNREIIFISEDGVDALKAVRYLLQMGYSEVYSVEGGMNNWPYNQYLESE
jgi:rhodanese-related sulfurtransferase